MKQDLLLDPLYRCSRQVLLSGCGQDDMARALEIFDETWDLYSPDDLEEILFRPGRAGTLGRRP